MGGAEMSLRSYAHYATCAGCIILLLAPQARVFIVDLKSVLLCHLAITSAVIMAHFSRDSLSLFPVILSIVFLLPFCQSRNVVASRQLTGTVTMADVNFSCPAGGKWYVSCTI
jgi:hypothetical protein